MVSHICSHYTELFPNMYLFDHRHVSIWSWHRATLPPHIVWIFVLSVSAMLIVFLMYVNKSVHMYIYIYIYIYMHPHTHKCGHVCICIEKKRYGIVYYCIWLWICSQSKLAKWFGKYMTIERANICLWVLLSFLKKNLVISCQIDNTTNSVQNMNLTTECYIVTRWQSLYTSG